MVVVLKSTKCGKHMTKVAQPVPAVRAVNPLTNDDDQLVPRRHRHRCCLPRLATLCGGTTIAQGLVKLSKCMQTAYVQDIRRYAYFLILILTLKKLPRGRGFRLFKVKIVQKRVSVCVENETFLQIVFPSKPSINVRNSSMRKNVNILTIL